MRQRGSGSCSIVRRRFQRTSERPKNMGALLSRGKHPKVAPPSANAPPLTSSAQPQPESLLPTPRQPPNQPVSTSQAGAPLQPPPMAAPAPNPGRALVKALKEGDVAKVATLLDDDHQAELLERRGMWDNTPLLVACHYGHEPLALMLLERGASASAVNEVGCTALLFACNEAMEPLCVRLLADPSVDVNPPACMVYSKHTDETNSRTPLQAAAESGFTAGVKLLLGRGAIAEPVALGLAAARGHADACTALLPPLLQQPPPPPSAVPAAAPLPWLSDALAAAAGRGHEAAVEALCRGAPPAAASACAGAALRVTCALSGPDGPAQGEGSGPRERILRCLCALEPPAESVDPSTGGSALHLAASRGLRTATAMILALPSADASRLDGSGMTPAALALAAGHVELAEMLQARTQQGGGSRPPSGRSALPPLSAPTAGAPSVPPSPSPRAEPLPLPPLPPASPRAAEAVPPGLPRPTPGLGAPAPPPAGTLPPLSPKGKGVAAAAPLPKLAPLVGVAAPGAA